MPDKSMSVATYAAGASLAAITLIYVFGPTYFIDNETNSTRKKTIVGLVNPANDCFINSVLQALAGLGDLRSYLIREIHRRNLDEQWVYDQAVLSLATRNIPEWKIHGLQSGIVTKGLKAMLDALNERPIARKSITAAPFIRDLERAFRQRISRQQQDAQEFLQIVAERLSEEYHAGHRARISARKSSNSDSDKSGQIHAAASRPRAESSSQRSAKSRSTPGETTVESPFTDSSPSVPTIKPPSESEKEYEEEEGFPIEGAYSSQIECMTCHYKPKPTESTFCTLTLAVPRISATSLNDCFDGMFKKEEIEDWKCERCRLFHAIARCREQAAQADTREKKAELEDVMKRLRHAADTDPEKLPEGVDLPKGMTAPPRKIERHTYMTRFPKILAIHLSRSIYDANSSVKNSAKVSFPENLKVGSLTHGMENYKLLAVVTHKGNHHSGHYETFRRQNVYPPFSNPATFQPSGVYSKTGSPMATPQMKAMNKFEPGGSPLGSTPDLLAPASGRSGTASPDSPVRKSVDTLKESPSGSSRSRVDQIKDAESSSIKSVTASAKSGLSKLSFKSGNGNGSGQGKANSNGFPSSRMPKRKKKKISEKWWRISDDKIKETRTSNVLLMHKEVYLLFYELDRGN
ncbi:hypothetical protein MKZ38_001405 [Zalerion maritima]|uniref:Ubiquitin carboxyl-terminal hydrolase n=1 Tax=Zalerion maritima TaxID=339359 RepID=A0AAD5RQX8_9PEZI|nr:hypothetical protein MKZ38_001405 [Zalerion maritima]